MASSLSFRSSIQLLFFSKISFLQVSSLGRSQGQIQTLVFTGLAIKFQAYSCRYLDRRRKGTIALGAGSLALGAIGFRLVSSKNSLPKALIPSRSLCRSAISWCRMANLLPELPFSLSSIQLNSTFVNFQTPFFTYRSSSLRSVSSSRYLLSLSRFSRRGPHTTSLRYRYLAWKASSMRVTRCI